MTERIAAAGLRELRSVRDRRQLISGLQERVGRRPTVVVALARFVQPSQIKGNDSDKKKPEARTNRAKKKRHDARYAADNHDKCEKQFHVNPPQFGT
jgi:hypothetical protein